MLKELFLREQFLHSYPPELAVFVMERSPSNMEAIKELADVYAASRSVVSIKETVKRNDMQDKLCPSHYLRSTGKSSHHPGRDSRIRKPNLPSPVNP